MILKHNCGVNSGSVRCYEQVFFIHNRIENIKEVAGLIQRLVPDAKVAVSGFPFELLMPIMTIIKVNMILLYDFIVKR